MYMPDTSTLGAAGDPAALYSTSDFTAWAKFVAGTSASLPIVTPNFATAPDGTKTATRIQFNRGNSTNQGQYSILRKVNIPVSAGVNTVSLYMRATPGAAAANIDIRPYWDNTTETNKVVTTGANWQRYNAQSPAYPSGVPMQLDLLLWDNQTNAPNTSQVADILVWGLRVDPGAVPLGEDYAVHASSPGKISPLALVGIAVAGFALFGGNGRR